MATGKVNLAATMLPELSRSWTSRGKELVEPQSTGGSPAAIGGIASLIAASHSALPVAPITTNLTLTTDFKKMITNVIPSNTLAPSTLANPPAPTYLSKSAIAVGAEHGLALSEAGDGGMPGGLMANLWGSSNWGYVNRLEPKPNRQLSATPGTEQTSSRAPSPVRSLGSHDIRGEMADLTSVQSAPAIPPTQQKSASVSQDLSTYSQKSNFLDSYPNYYPMTLKAQDAQFRMLFPHANRNDKLVMVFRAVWNPSDRQEFPGRVYVTMNDIYFYSNYLGFVLITGVSLESVLEITAAPGKECDFLFIHLKEGVRPDGATRLTVKTFLEPLKLLQRRLNFLIQNQESDEPAGLEETIKTLIRMEANEAEGESPSMESWEDVPIGTPFDAFHGGRYEQDLKTSLRIDGSLFPDASKRISRNITKFRLPTHPVEFMPQGFRTPVVEREFDVTAKSLFHVLAGDRSAVFQILYCQRSADRK